MEVIAGQKCGKEEVVLRDTAVEQQEVVPIREEFEEEVAAAPP